MSGNQHMGGHTYTTCQPNHHHMHTHSGGSRVTMVTRALSDHSIKGYHGYLCTIRPLCQGLPWLPVHCQATLSRVTMVTRALSGHSVKGYHGYQCTIRPLCQGLPWLPIYCQAAQVLVHSQRTHQRYSNLRQLSNCMQVTGNSPLTSVLSCTMLLSKLKTNIGHFTCGSYFNPQLHNVSLLFT